ncbi:MAG: Pr6Pr family membrane protein [Microbacteriaceae bacterium]|nr:Pr6Pr family membrane protein [Microbacteriaceae bacterium]
MKSLETIPVSRKLRGTLDISMGLLIIAAYIDLISGQLAEGTFTPATHFAYLTNQTSYSNIVVLIAGGILAWTRATDTVLYATVRANFAVYAVVVCLVYNWLLREPDHFDFHNEVTHVAIPIYLLADWVIRARRPRIGWNTLWIGVSYPIVWALITLVRGQYVDWYPYFFLNPTEGLGWSGVALYIAGITLIFLAAIAGAVGINRIHQVKP